MLRQGFPAALAVAIGLGLGADAPKKKAGPPPKVEETLSQLADVVSTGEIPVEGVGLVIGLDGTGANPEASADRKKLVDLMQKTADHIDAEGWLASKTTAMVKVRAKLPTGITKADRFDVEVEVPAGDAATSLAGGRLLRVELHYVGQTKEGPMEGRAMAVALGPVLVEPGTGPDALRRGRVLGAAHVLKDVPFTIVIKSNRKGFKSSALIQAAINGRFEQHDGIRQTKMATAKTDEIIQLAVPPIYHQNQGRYFQIIGRLPILTNDELIAQRMAKWSRSLLDPATAGDAALRLEGLGRVAIPALKAGLESPDATVRFFAAEALAYLDDASGVDVLAAAAADGPAFRAQALAALAASDQPAAHDRLQTLMANPSAELRYGAFSALRTLDPNHPFLGRRKVLFDEPEDPDAAEAADAMALQLQTTPRRRPRPLPEPFTLYVVKCDGPPMVHASRSRRREIVVFGEGQRMLTPIVVGAQGNLLLNAADGDQKVQIQRITPSRPDEPERRASSPLDVAEVVRQAANLRASYPEILDMLAAAGRQRNLPGPIVDDALPTASKAYDQAQLAGAPSKKDDAVGRTSLEEGKRRSILERLRGRMTKP